MLKVENLKVKVAGKLVVNKVSFELRPKEVLALMGPNGSGKSSLAYTLAGHPHYQVVAGKLTLDGRLLNELSPDEKSQAGLFLAFQYPVAVEGVRYARFLWEAYQTRFQTESPRSMPRIDSIVGFQAYLEDLAQQLEIDKELLDRSLNFGFSGGEKKKLEILQLLLLEPKYAVLDETDSGLDIDALQVVARGVKLAIERFNLGALLITHYQRILNYLEPDKVFIMKSGKIIKEGGKELVDRLEKEGYKEL